jgi:hypothetical protein
MPTYIRFETPKSSNVILKDGLIAKSLKKLIVRFLALFIPTANPDFENKIDKVKYWLIECDNETGIPQREVGLDEEEKIILKMPYRKNYGYWIDNNLLLNDFKEHFIISEISKQYFEESWIKAIE